MCGRFGQTKKIIGEHAGIKIIAGELFKDNYNVSTGNAATIILNAETTCSAIFGFTPQWETQAKYYINARSEGKLNPENNESYRGPFGIFEMPSFRESITKNRCLIPVDYFIEGPEKEKLSKPYLIERKDKQIFLLGAIYSDFVEPSTGEITRTFCVLTTPASYLLKGIGHHRSPLIISSQISQKWLDEKLSREEISSFFSPFDSADFHSYRISNTIKSPNKNFLNNSPSLRNPVQEDLRLNFD